MKQIKLLLFIILLYLAGQTSLQAQETVSASGGNATGNSGSISYTVGQVFYSSVSSTTGKLTEGAQQPYEITRVTTSHKIMELSDAVSVYPNPATEHVLIEIENLVDENIQYQLINARGQLLSVKKIIGSHTVVSMGNYVPSVYFIKILQNQEEVTTFKIIRN